MDREPTSSRERRLFDLLRAAEQKVLLLDRVQPQNAGLERARLREVWREGRPSAPLFRYSPAPDLSDVRRALQAMACAEPESLVEELCAERAVELELEASLVEAVASATFATIARQRFVASDSEVHAADTLARAWISLQPASTEESRHRSDDRSDPKSLLFVLERELARLRLPIRLEVREALSSTAATGDGLIAIRGGAWLRERDAERIALHEIEAHALPRIRARARGGIYAAGSARASDDEEGRAIWLEERAGYLDDTRRNHLARRHLAALAIRDGASFVETVELLRTHETPLEAALDLGCRVIRGGGLAREFVYLTAFARAKSAFEQNPALEPVLAEGRLGVAAAGRILANSSRK